MQVTIRIPSALRSKAGARTRFALEAHHVADALRWLEAAHPALAPLLREQDGTVRPRVNVYVNDVHVRYLDGLETSLQDGDQVYVVPTVMGG